MYCSLVNLVSGHNFIHLNFLGLFIVIAVAAIFSKVSFYSLFRKDKKESVNDSVLEKTIPMLKDGNISLDVALFLNDLSYSLTKERTKKNIRLSFLYTTLTTSLFLFSASGELLVSIIFAIISNQVFKIVIDILKSKNKKSEFLDVIALEKTMVYVNLKFTNHLTSIKNYLIQYKMIILIKKPLMV